MAKLSNQPIATLIDDVIQHYNAVIPECYKPNMPYIRVCTTSAK